MKKNTALDDKIFEIAVVVISIIIFLIILYPLWFVVIASISNSNLVNLGKVTFYPRDIRFYGFKQILDDKRIWTGYRNTLLYVIAGTALNLVATLPAAYALSRKDFKPRTKIMFYFVFTMFFNGGLVPTYMTVSSLHLVSTKTILIVFMALNTYNLIIARTFMESSIPDDLYEAAILDGCSHFKYFIKVVFPLSKALNVVLILYYAVYHWNDYFNALIYNNKAANAPLQTILREILLLNQAFQNGVGGVQGGYGQSSADQVKYAVIIVSTVPILVFYPFVQKYFEKGVMIGAVKG